jgi:hypothetical protein
MWLIKGVVLQIAWLDVVWIIRKNARCATKNMRPLITYYWIVSSHDSFGILS